MEPAGQFVAAEPRRWSAQLVLALALGVYALVVVRTAWLGDDAYITLRVVENWAQGHGLRWNADERVLVSTHPLWLLILGALRSLTSEVYFTTLAASAACALLAVSIVTRQARSTALATALIVALSLSRAFVDYSTSGLENALAYPLAGAFAASYLAPTSRYGMLRLSLWASLLMATRHDFVLLVAPTLLRRWYAQRSWRTTRALALGQAPLLAWLGFATWYFGSPLPMPSHAKLFSTGIPLTALLEQGAQYCLATLRHDPLTLPLLGLGILAGLTTTGTRALALGVVAYVAYVLRIGGDFMLGRFFAVPLFVAMLCAARHPWLVARRTAWGLGLVVAAVGLAMPHATWRSDGEYVGQGTVGPGIIDERGAYYPTLGLLSPNRAPPAFGAAAALLPGATRERPAIVVQYAVGTIGFAFGAAAYVVDPVICDPLLCRLPSAKPTEWRIGHLERNIPAGYLQSLARGRNELRHPALARYYDAVRELARGELGSMARLRTIWAFARGHYDHLRAEYLASDYYAPQPTRVRIESLPQIAERAPWHAEGVVGVHAGGVAVELGEVRHAPALEISLHSQAHYRIEFRRGEQVVAETLVPTNPGIRYGMSACTVTVPTDAQTAGFDSLLVYHDLGGSIDHVGAMGQVTLR